MERSGIRVFELLPSRIPLRFIRATLATAVGYAALERQGRHSHAGALAVIHKCKRPVIPAWTAGIQSQGCEPRGWQLT